MEQYVFPKYLQHGDMLQCQLILMESLERYMGSCYNGRVQLYTTNVNKLTHFLGLPLGLFSPVVSAFCKCQQP